MARAAKKTAPPKFLERRLCEAAEGPRGNWIPSRKCMLPSPSCSISTSGRFHDPPREPEASLIAEGCD